MSILLPEKIFQSILTSGLASIKATPTILDDIFDEDVLGETFITQAKAYIAAKTIRVAQGYTIDDNRLPSWHVVPPSISPGEEFIGEYANEQDFATGESVGDMYEGSLQTYNLRIISASDNADVTMLIEAIARYLLFANRNTVEETYGLIEISISATDLDPVYQHLPQNLFYRSSIVSFKALNTWSKEFPIITDATIFAKFNTNEIYFEI
ncbi:MAG: hypothetical protein JEZ11_24575 [Desulfobacterales bacterium]|nr:hypothetical protein [Desulfobacterales bacterium]